MRLIGKQMKRMTLVFGLCALCMVPGRVLAQEDLDLKNQVGPEARELVAEEVLLPSPEEQALYSQAEEALELSLDINAKLARLSQAVEQAKEEEAQRQAEAARRAERRKAAFEKGAVNGAAYFNQTDSQYRDYPFASSNVYMAGCGPFSAAMAVSTLMGEVLDPLEFVDFANSKGYAISGVGISWSYFSAIASEYDMTVTRTSDPDAAIQALEDGKVVLMSQSAALGGYWTNGGHIVLLVGQTDEGKFLVNDPASRRRTDQSHTYNQVFTPNKMMWIMSAE